MGGGYWQLGRLPREQYLEIEAKLRVFLDECFGRDNYRIPRYYDGKKDFGDVDILLSDRVKASGSHSWESVRKDITEGLSIERYGSINKCIFSTVYDNFQVDFFLESHQNMLTKSNFMDFNDLGNLIGRLFRPFRLKYSDRGMFYVYKRTCARTCGNFKKEILVSTDWKDILTFVGLDYEAWERGFDEIEEMFKWIIASPFFCSSPYTDPSSKVVKRGAKLRTTMKLFLKYVKEHAVQRAPVFLDKNDYVVLIDETFPRVGLRRKIEEERLDEEAATILHAKFNGTLAMEWVPKLEGKSLGSLMGQFNGLHSRDRLMEMDPLDIRISFIKLYEEHVSQSTKNENS